MLTTEDLILKDYDEAHHAKEFIESKAGNYMVAITLIMSMSIQFITRLSGYEICPELKKLGIVFYSLPLFIGIVLLFLFVSVLKPRLLQFFDLAALLKLHREDGDDSKKSEVLVKSCENYAVVNDETINEMRSINKIVHKFAYTLVILFAVACAVFFALELMSLGGK